MSWKERIQRIKSNFLLTKYITMEVLKRNPKTTILAILSIVSILWSALSDNAEIFGVSGQVISIGTVVLTAIGAVYNSIYNTTE